MVIEMQEIEILLRGHIDSNWSDWLGDMAVDHTGDGNTLLSGAIRDQAALYGLISRLSDLGFQLISVSPTKYKTPGEIRR
jgi:hypothetical protein